MLGHASNGPWKSAPGRDQGCYLRCFWLMMLLVAFMVLTLPMLLLAGEGGYDWDEKNYHIPAILMIRGTWPLMDVKAVSLSAISPGYHYLLASLSFLVGSETLSLRIVNWLFSAALLVLLYSWASCRVEPKVAALVMLPLCASNFFCKSASWIVTDNAALLFVTIVLVGLLARELRPMTSGSIGIAAFLATFSRQISVWLVAPMWVRALVSGPLIPKSWCSSDTARANQQTDWRLVFFSLPALTVVGWLWLSWGGLVPEKWRHAAYGLSACPIAYLLSVAALLGLPYLLFLDVRPWREVPSAVMSAAAGVGLAAALLSPTAFDYEQGRWGGYLWEAAKRLPVWFDRSAVFLVAAPIGGMIVGSLAYALWKFANRPAAVVWLASFCAWAATFVPNRQVFHRYFEPTLIVFFVLAVVLATSGRCSTFPAGKKWPLVGLTMAQVALTIAIAWKKSFLG